MSDPFVGEIRLFAFPRVPNGWLACNGQSVSIAEYQTLYAIIGTIYGGDGQTTFNLPDLQGRSRSDRGRARVCRTSVSGNRVVKKRTH
ncbi:microcystin-dependent protein [Bradyrhizobium japonicum]|uniref:Microcystin-dependent protein n=1 Tax=Bradyrhizobium japonicum TaxID=375 RepID=A0ABV2RXN9_BRAJP|nr:tail fiber protein [Bradyrhizobium japonicum]WLB23467.1 tail fiber protein [Bradyrhizobium japonicum]